MAATGNKNADKIIKVLRTLTKNDLGTVTNDTENIGLNREITKNTYIQPIIDDLIMEHKKKINLLYNTSNKSFKFRTKNWVEVNDNLRGMYNTNSQIRTVNNSEVEKNMIKYYC